LFDLAEHVMIEPPALIGQNASDVATITSGRAGDEPIIDREGPDRDHGLIWLPVAALRPHPQNPRLVIREDVVNSIAAQLRVARRFDPAHALLVRPHPDGPQIVAGHHRWYAAQRAELLEVPCWVREMSDEEALMRLVQGNTQGELTALELGIHVLAAVQHGEKGRGKKGGLRVYADQVGRDESYLRQVRKAAEVFQAISENAESAPHFLDKAQHLTAIHQAPSDTWPMLARTLLAEGWSTADTEAAVARVKDVCAVVPTWWDTLDRPRLAGLVAVKEARGLRMMFQQAGELAARLEPVTVYVLYETDEVDVRQGREYRRYVPMAEPYDPRAVFCERLRTRLAVPDAAQVRELYAEIVQTVEAMAQLREEWRPVLTNAEWQESQARQAELAALERLRRYTATVIQADVLQGLRQLADESVDLICTDPPYNMGKADWDHIKNYGVWAESWLRECFWVLKPTGALYVFGRVGEDLAQVLLRLGTIGFVYRGDIVWDTLQGAGGGLWPPRHETILYATKTAETYTDPQAVQLERHEVNIREYKGVEWSVKTAGDVWRFPVVDGHHPDRVEVRVQKPLALIERIIKASCPPDGVVLDCFAGSGTTGVAAMRLERRSILIDRDAEVLSLAQRRFEATEVGAGL
jgi:site-specific DNA-methyltransferase (adenine-specific)